MRPWTSYVEVHWSDTGEAYVTPVGPSSVGVAFLWDGSGQRFDALLARFPLLRERLKGATPLDRVRGAGPFAQRVRRRFAPGVALVGDAAGYVDPLTGEGLTLGFDSARLLVDVIGAEEPLPMYERAYRRASRTHVALTRTLLSVSARPAIRRRMIRALAHNPRIFAALVGINAGDAGWPRVGVLDALRAISGVLP